MSTRVELTLSQILKLNVNVTVTAISDNLTKLEALEMAKRVLVALNKSGTSYASLHHNDEPPVRLSTRAYVYDEHGEEDAQNYTDETLIMEPITPRNEEEHIA